MPADHPEQVALEQQVGAAAEQDGGGEREGEDHRSALVVRCGPDGAAARSAHRRTSRNTPTSNTSGVNSSSAPIVTTCSPGPGRWLTRRLAQQQGEEARWRGRAAARRRRASGRAAASAGPPPRRHRRARRRPARSPATTPRRRRTRRRPRRSPSRSARPRPSARAEQHPRDDPDHRVRPASAPSGSPQPPPPQQRDHPDDRGEQHRDLDERVQAAEVGDDHGDHVAAVRRRGEPDDWSDDTVLAAGWDRKPHTVANTASPATAPATTSRRRVPGADRLVEVAVAGSLVRAAGPTPRGTPA